jgi:flagellar biosynthesis regulator FlaF
MQYPKATHAIIIYRGARLSNIERKRVKDLSSDDHWVSFVTEVEVPDNSLGMQGRVKTVEHLFWVRAEWVIEIEVLP